MCHNRMTNRKINRLHGRCLRIIYNDKQSSFKMLLEKDSSVSIRDRNIQCLATKIYKVSNWLSPPVVSNIFTQKNCHPYNLRLNSQFSRPLVRSVFHGTESISYLGPVIQLFFLIVTKTYLILVFLKTGLKNGNLKIVPADFVKHTFLESALHRRSLW